MRAAGLLFTDLEGSTRHLRALGPRYGQVLARHHTLIRAAISAGGGTEIGSEGDSIAAVLRSPSAAMQAAIGAQHALVAEPWPDSPWRVRMAVHAGDVEIHGDTAVGVVLHEAARIRNVGFGGQVLISDSARLALDEQPTGLQLLDLGLHEIRDIEGPIRLYQVVSPGLSAQFPPLRTASVRRVPRALTSFVGRKAEVEEILLALQECRVLTISGPGGSGKTRLAYAVAERVPTADVVVTELADLRDPAQVGHAIAAAVGATDPDALASAISDRELLLVLDNCEHVLDGVAAVVSLLITRCPQLSILSTSRAALSIRGEVVWNARGLEASNATALFVARSAVYLGERDALLVNAICERLSGSPLAIELAAARLRSMPLADLAARLDDQLGLLTGGARDVPRHQTLRATLDWSIDLLDLEQRVTLRRLSVFAGGFTLPAAEAVVKTPTPVDVLVSLDDLVGQSLVDFNANLGRYFLLEPVRQYAAERLADAGEVSDAHRAHLRWAVALADRAGREFFIDQAAWTTRLDAESANLSSALAWAVSHDADAGARLIAGLANYWYTARRQGADVFVSRMLDHIDELAPRSRAGLLLGAGITFSDLRDDDRPVLWLADAVATFRELEHQRGLGTALFWSGRALAIRGREDEMRPLFEEGASVHEAIGDVFGLGWCRIWLSLIAHAVDRDTERAIEIAQGVLESGERNGVMHLVAAALNQLAEFNWELGRDDEAIDLITRAIEVFEIVGDRWQTAGSHMHRALYLGHAEPALAVPDVLAALETGDLIRAEDTVRSCLGYTAVLLAEAGRRQKAAVLAAAASLNVVIFFGYADVHSRLRGVLDTIGELTTDPTLTGSVAEGRRLAIRAATQLATEWLADAYPAEASSTSRNP